MRKEGGALWNSRLLNYAPVRVNWRILPILAWLLLSTGLLAAQATFSAGPLLLHQVRAIYVAPSSDELVLLVRARLEKWDAVMITSKVQKWIGPCGKGRRGFFETICGDWNMAD